VTIAIPRLIRIATFEYNNIRTFNFVGSMPIDSKERDYVYQTLNLELESGKLIESSDRRKVVLGSDFASSKDYEKEIRVGSKVLIQGEAFEVVGILKKAGSFTINSVILMNEDELKDILNIDDEIDIIIAQVDSTDKVEQTAEDIKRKLRKDRKLKEGEEDFSVDTPISSLESVNLIINIINIIVSGIAAISLLVGGIGITNSMFTSVLERTKQIGVMKAVGAKNSDVLKLFLIESGLLGLVGGIVGAAIGLGLAFLVSSIANNAFGQTILEVSVSYSLLIAAISFSFLIGIISGIVPAIQASRLKPVEALRA
jgi:putative ABC transport system permease protein